MVLLYKYTTHHIYTIYGIYIIPKQSCYTIYIPYIIVVHLLPLCICCLCYATCVCSATLLSSKHLTSIISQHNYNIYVKKRLHSKYKHVKEEHDPNTIIYILGYWNTMQ